MRPLNTRLAKTETVNTLGLIPVFTSEIKDKETFSELTKCFFLFSSVHSCVEICVCVINSVMTLVFP